MARKINCKDCGKYLGEIRDAKLSKNIVYKCTDCEKSRQASTIIDDPNFMYEAYKMSRKYGDH